MPGQLNFTSKVNYKKNMPLSGFDFAQDFLLYDSELDNCGGGVEKFIHSFENRLGVKGGEGLKDFAGLVGNFDKILSHWQVPVRRNSTLVVFGGGSLGDYGGFVASIIKRGVRLVQIPSTWLAAIDSAHGGKTALNYKGVKNQVGTFYPAEKVYIIRELLQTVPDTIRQQAFGELIKMSLIGHKQFFTCLVESPKEDFDLFWKFVKLAIDAKYKVVAKDPLENLGIRQCLNFGHTFGHIFESYFSLSHGESVLQGIFFALNWSCEKGLLKEKKRDQIFNDIATRFALVPACESSGYQKINSEKFEELLLQDKKALETNKVQFVFLRSLGKWEIETVNLDSVIKEGQRQGWVQ